MHSIYVELPHSEMEFLILFSWARLLMTFLSVLMGKMYGGFLAAVPVLG